MKIAVTSKGKTLGSEVDPRFGRAAYILLVNSETLEFEVIDNIENVNAFKGAGIQVASMASNKGVEVVLTGMCGPKAFGVLAAAKIKVVNDISGTVEDALGKFKRGEVIFADAPSTDQQ